MVSGLPSAGVVPPTIALHTLTGFWSARLASLPRSGTPEAADYGAGGGSAARARGKLLSFFTGAAVIALVQDSTPRRTTECLHAYRILQAQVEKLLKNWQIEGVFGAEQLRDVESGRGALGSSGSGLAGAGGAPHPLHSKSPSGSLTEASAQVSSEVAGMERVARAGEGIGARKEGGDGKAKARIMLKGAGCGCGTCCTGSEREWTSTGCEWTSFKIPGGALQTVAAP